MESKAYCIQGSTLNRKDTNGPDGNGWCEELSYTLNTFDIPAVSYVNKSTNPTDDGSYVIVDTNANSACDYEICGTLTRHIGKSVTFVFQPKESQP